MWSVVRGNQVVFTMENLHFEAVGALCGDPGYKGRLFFDASSKQPALKLTLAKEDSLKACKAFLEKLGSYQDLKKN